MSRTSFSASLACFSRICLSASLVLLLCFCCKYSSLRSRKRHRGYRRRCCAPRGHMGVSGASSAFPQIRDTPRRAGHPDPVPHHAAQRREAQTRRGVQRRTPLKQTSRALSVSCPGPSARKESSGPPAGCHDGHAGGQCGNADVGDTTLPAPHVPELVSTLPALRPAHSEALQTS